MSLFQSFILGIVQGLTEFLPLSSTYHLYVVPALLRWEDPGTAFSAVLQLGTMLAVVIYFWNDLIKIYGSFLKDLISFFRNKDSTFLHTYESKLAFWILLGTIPICIFGLLFKIPLEAGIVRDLNFICFIQILFSVLLFISEIRAKKNRSLSKINALDVLLIGLVQTFALIPGASRSGVTLFAGLLLGFKRSDAARFSFLLSVPAVLLSGVLELNTLVSSTYAVNNQIVWTKLLVGIITAFFSGYFAIGFLLKYLQTHKTHVFVAYRILIAVLVIYLNLTGFITHK